MTKIDLALLALAHSPRRCHCWQAGNLGFTYQRKSRAAEWVRAGMAGAALSAFVALIPGLCFAQQPVITYSKGTTSSNASGTVTTGGVFQKIFGASSVRAGCAIQNNSTNTMYVTEGLGVANSTTGKAVAL